MSGFNVFGAAIVVTGALTFCDLLQGQNVQDVPRVIPTANATDRTVEEKRAEALMSLPEDIEGATKESL